MEATEMMSRARWMRIIPAVFLMYTISYFDRVNIGLAIPSMSKSLALTPAEAGLAGGIFFWGYLITFLAAGWLAPRFGARMMVFCSLVAWGFFAMLSGLVRNFDELLLVRFLLGAAEGPVWTSTSMLLAQWFLKPERARAFGLWNLCIPMGALLAGPISGFVLAHYDWRVMFVIEGLPAWVWAVVWWFAIPSSLQHASWLDPIERDRVAAALAREQSSLGAQRRERWSVGVAASLGVAAAGRVFADQHAQLRLLALAADGAEIGQRDGDRLHWPAERPALFGRDRWTAGDYHQL